ncbi:MAG TPA: GNAT family N-acetyltransferase [Hyphomicrobiaceae bacterium]|jgi:GNAT superfamily N-acetyltransferase|nr:GNAT family N-acetyltransferase [Hyphomicrobiaceae bacterium]
MIVRAARPDDAQAAATVLRRSIAELCQADHQGDAETLRRWLANKTPEQVRIWLADPDRLLVVAEDDGRILGVAAVQTSGRISLNYVSPDGRFRGVSKALVRDLERQARALCLEACVLESTRTALAFYRRMGYTGAGDPQPRFGVVVGYPMRKSLGAGL